MQGVQPALTRMIYEPLVDTPSIQLITPGDPGFLGELLQMSTASDVEILRPVLPYSIVIKNASGDDVISVVIRFQIEDQGGGATQWSTMQYQAMASRDGFMLARGKSFFVSPVRGVLNRAVTHGKLRSIPRVELSAMIDRAVSTFVKRKPVRVVLDSVLFEDGGFIGKDVTNRFAMHSGEFRAESDFKAEIANRSSQQLLSYLNHLKGIPDDGLQMSQKSEAGHYNYRKQHLAESMLAALSMKSEQDLKREVSERLPTTARIYRRSRYWNGCGANWFGNVQSSPTGLPYVRVTGRQGQSGLVYYVGFSEEDCNMNPDSREFFHWCGDGNPN